MAAPGFDADLARKWTIASAELIAETHSSMVYRVRRRGGGLAVAKLLKPQGAQEAIGFDFLDWRQGKGAVRLLERHGNACLIEDAGSETLLTYRLRHGEDAANAVICDLVRELHSPSPCPHPAGLTPLHKHFDALFNDSPGVSARDPALSQYLRWSAGIAEQLLAAQRDIRPLHGDIHHENIMNGRRGWLAIDPQGLAGDPAYDIANVFGNPDGAFDDIVNPLRIAGLLRHFAAVIGCSGEKILAYAIAHAGLSICWSLQDGASLSSSANAAERLAFLKVAATLPEAEALVRP